MSKLTYQDAVEILDHELNQQKDCEAKLQDATVRAKREHGILKQLAKDSWMEMNADGQPFLPTGDRKLGAVDLHTAKWQEAEGEIAKLTPLVNKQKERTKTAQDDVDRLRSPR